jgi:A/G-specific adenine glycosylase
MILPLDFSAKLLAWFDKSGAILPWRGGNAYQVWLSEIMLQQTQIETVIPYYHAFLTAYPTVDDLANAPLEDVLKKWEGLGYYRRARHLHETARAIVAEHGGTFPADVAVLLRLKGIGRYTAGAIASIAYGTRAPVLDGNVVRVFARLLDLSDDVSQTTTQAALWRIAEAHLPQERVGDYNQALMQLGQLVCTPKAPKCNACPLAHMCKAHANGTQAQRPYKPAKAKTPHYDVVAGVVRDASGRYLIAQRKPDGLLGGLWEFAGGKVEAGEAHAQALQRELREELAIEVRVGELLTVVKHAFTHFKITLYAYECTYVGAIAPYDSPQALDCQAWAWVEEADLAQYAFGKADRAVIAELKHRKTRLL